MITLTRSQVRRLRVAFRRAALGIAHRGIVSELVLRAEGAQLRAQHRYCDLAVEHVEAAGHQPAATVAVPPDALADFEGAADTPVVIEAVAPDRTVVRWEDRGIPQSREYGLITPVDRLEPMPAAPATWASNPAGLLDALAEAAETSTPDPTRYALEVPLLPAPGLLRLQVVVPPMGVSSWRTRASASRGRRTCWIKGTPLIFACRALPSRPAWSMSAGPIFTHVFVRVGPWTISCAIQTDVRYPGCRAGHPAAFRGGDPAAAGPRGCRLPGGGAGAAAGRRGDQRAGDDRGQRQGGRARGDCSDQPDRVHRAGSCSRGRATPARRSASASTGTHAGARALRLGYTELGFTGIDTAFLCRDSARIYAVQPLGGGSPPGADAEVTHIESGMPGGGEGRVVTRPETTRRTTTVRESRNGHEPAPATEDRNHAVARPAEAVSTAGNEQPGTSLAALMQEAESLHAALADAKSRTARLISGLRRQRKQSRLVNETLKSLRQLKLVEAAG